MMFSSVAILFADPDLTAASDQPFFFKKQLISRTHGEKPVRRKNLAWYLRLSMVWLHRSRNEVDK
jgi:hypothetical protein